MRCKQHSSFMLLLARRCIHEECFPVIACRMFLWHVKRFKSKPIPINLKRTHALKARAFKDLGKFSNRLSDDVQMSFRWSRSRFRYIFLFIRELRIDRSSAERRALLLHRFFNIHLYLICKRTNLGSILGRYTRHLFHETGKLAFASKKSHLDFLELLKCSRRLNGLTGLVPNRTQFWFEVHSIYL